MPVPLNLASTMLPICGGVSSNRVSSAGENCPSLLHARQQRLHSMAERCRRKEKDGERDGGRVLHGSTMTRGRTRGIPRCHWAVNRKNRSCSLAKGLALGPSASGTASLPNGVRNRR